MELTDIIQVELTIEGAEYLNSKSWNLRAAERLYRDTISEKELDRLHPVNYHPGYIWRGTMSQLFCDPMFSELHCRAKIVPFTNIQKVEE